MNSNSIVRFFTTPIYFDNLTEKTAEFVGKVFTSEAAILLLGVGGIASLFVGK